MRKNNGFVFLLPCLFPLVCLAAESRPRLVSLAPSLTEMVFALGAGSLLAGVSENCRYPPEARDIPKIGLYLTPNYEIILTLRPDLVLMLAEHAPARPALEALGLAYEVFDHRRLAGLLESFSRLGGICGAQERAGELRAEVESAFLRPAPTPGTTPPNILVVLGRDYGVGGIANAYVIGKDDLYNQLIEAVGCRNAYRGDLAYPVLSGESIASLSPDIVIETVFAEMGTAIPNRDLLRDWSSSLANLQAVREGRVFYLRNDYIFVPGHRLVLLKRDLAAIVRQAFPGLLAPP
ncbi:MAG: helical backbone metal receptor [Planctomycetes bacterium]|nr:helical backbone metal receptor [Planctomycetota bacterium]